MKEKPRNISEVMPKTFREYAVTLLMRRYRITRDDAEDAVGEAISKALIKYQNGGVRNLSALTMYYAKLEALNLKRRRLMASLDWLTEQTGERPAPDDFAERLVQNAALSQALHDLDDREYSVVWLYYNQQYSHAEIAAELSITEANSKTILSRCRRKLRAHLCIRD